MCEEKSIHWIQPNDDEIIYVDVRAVDVSMMIFANFFLFLFNLESVFNSIELQTI